jgi:hypothetical protein
MKVLLSPVVAFLVYAILPAEILFLMLEWEYFYGRGSCLFVFARLLLTEK